MSKTNTKILAIDPGIREMGIAFLDNGKLIYHDVKTIDRGKSNKETLKEGCALITRLICDFRPDTLAVEKTFFANSRNAAVLNAFTDEIKIIGKRKRLKVISYASSTVKKYIAGNGRASKREVAKVVVSRYPELKAYLRQNRKWKERYHLNMFDAVALAIMTRETIR
jgi:crossover junction endodeoxyribonuclease RuvC